MKSEASGQLCSLKKSYEIFFGKSLEKIIYNSAHMKVHNYAEYELHR